jgi:uncharacterized protein (DUF1800 family)
LDPVQVWQPWEPTDQDPWNLKWAGHLYRRATLGPIPPLGEEPRYDHLAKLREAVNNGLKATLERLFQGEPTTEERQRFLDEMGKQVLNQTRREDRFNPNPSPNTGANPLRGWWFYCMAYTHHPLREKLTLFWHNHFATSIVKVQNPRAMYYQNKLIRKHALGKFEPFLQEMSKDPAMLIWLDSNANVKGKPNENYARELMELFSLGVGNYTEKDIQEAARAFTGWHTDGERFEFKANQHDDGEKTVFGQTGKWDGDEIVRLCLKKEAAAQFLVRKLYRFFISETAAPPKTLLEPLADSLRKSDYDIGELVKTMLRSRLFFSDYAYRQRVKSPVEYVLFAAREVGQGFVEPRSLTAPAEEMGQILFAPPNVKGWEGGRSWLNTATVLARHNFAQLMTVGSGKVSLRGASDRPVGVASDPSSLVRLQKLTEPKDIVVLLLDILLQGDVAEPARAKLTDFLAGVKPGTDAWNERVRDLFHAIMTMPEYQLA